jgi:hypothetical protein
MICPARPPPVRPPSPLGGRRLHIRGNRRFGLPHPADSPDGFGVPFRVQLEAAPAPIRPRRIGRTLRFGSGLPFRPASLVLCPICPNFGTLSQ